MRSGRRPGFGVLDQLFNDFLTALNPRGDSGRSVVRIALWTSRDPRFREFLNRIYQPRCRRWSLAAIARSCGISFREFMVFWQRAMVEHAKMIACSAAPAVVEALGAAALGQEALWDRCDGLGWVYMDARFPPELVRGYLGPLTGDPEGRARRTCPACEGTGKVMKPGDVKAADKVLRIAGFDRERGRRTEGPLHV